MDEINKVDLGSKSDRRKVYRLFISHSWSYDEDYERLTDKLDDKNHFRYHNYSVPEEDEIDADTSVELRRHLRKKQIGPSSVVMVLAGMYSAHSYWIKKEMEIAEDLDKAIIGVEPWGQKKVPQDVQDAADEMVGWNVDSIVDAIRRRSP